MADKIGVMLNCPHCGKGLRGAAERAQTVAFRCFHCSGAIYVRARSSANFEVSSEPLPPLKHTEWPRGRVIYRAQSHVDEDNEFFSPSFRAALEQWKGIAGEGGGATLTKFLVRSDLSTRELWARLLAGVQWVEDSVELKRCEPGEEP